METVGAVGLEDVALMAEEVREGLQQPLPTLPCKYFYDDRGSALFEEITRTPEYYQTRTEERLLEQVADEIVASARPRELVELGSGVGRKIRALLDRLTAGPGLERCVFFDINRRFLDESVGQAAALYPGLRVRGVVGDFGGDLSALGPG